MSAEPGHGRGARRERLGAAGAVALGAALMLLAASRTWVHAVVQDPLAGPLQVDASGRQASPVVAAVALVALAGAVAVLTLRTVGRLVTGLLLVLSGAAAVAAAVDVLRTPSDALRSVIADATGRSGDLLPVAHQTSWAWVAVGGAVLVVLGGALTVSRARGWSGLSGRYDAPVGAPVEPGPQAAAADGGERAAPEASADPASDSWDRLSRGDDPTV
ncbi:MAG TPA: Trp biosynthesis-associated membrane protein [Actinomycetales bacterium]|nr:Trp biosynthesis-associated membrane protein [Actinomycetales bacterium]